MTRVAILPEHRTSPQPGTPAPAPVRLVVVHDGDSASGAEAARPVGVRDLKAHNRCVIAWAGRSDAKYRPVLMVLGFRADMATHQTPPTAWAKLVAALGSREHGLEPRSDATVKRHLLELERLGVIKVSRGKRGYADKSRGMNAANQYGIDFSKIVIRGAVRDGYDFYSGNAQSYDPKETVTDPKVDPKVDPVTSSTSSITKELASRRENEASRSSPAIAPASKPSAAPEHSPAPRRPSDPERQAAIDREFLPDAPSKVGREMAAEAVFRLYPGHDPAAVVAAVWEFRAARGHREVEFPKSYIRACRDTLTPLVAKHVGYAAERKHSEARARALAAREAGERRAREEAVKRDRAGHEARGEVQAVGTGQFRREWVPASDAVVLRPGVIFTKEAAPRTCCKCWAATGEPVFVTVR